jgi:hypothetical protein
MHRARERVRGGGEELRKNLKKNIRYLHKEEEEEEGFQL